MLIGSCTFRVVRADDSRASSAGDPRLRIEWTVCAERSAPRWRVAVGDDGARLETVDGVEDRLRSRRSEGRFVLFARSERGDAELVVEPRCPLCWSREREKLDQGSVAAEASEEGALVSAENVEVDACPLRRQDDTHERSPGSLQFGFGLEVPEDADGQVVVAQVFESSPAAVMPDRDPAIDLLERVAAALLHPDDPLLRRPGAVSIEGVHVGSEEVGGEHGGWASLRFSHGGGAVRDREGWLQLSGFWGLCERGSRDQQRPRAPGTVPWRHCFLLCIRRRP